MNNRIQKVVDKIFDKDEYVFQLSAKTGRSVKTIHRHWLGKDFNIPTEFLIIAYETALKVKSEQDKYIRSIETKYEEI